MDLWRTESKGSDEEDGEARIVVECSSNTDIFYPTQIKIIYPLHINLVVGSLVNSNSYLIRLGYYAPMDYLCCH